MKKMILTFAAFCLLMETNAQQKNQRNISNKKIAIGIGISALELKLGAMGGNVKFDYLINKKISVGLKAILTDTQLKNSFVTPDSSGETAFIGYNDHGHHFNLSLTSTAYILGKNQGNGGGLYTIVGVGYSHRKYVYDVTGFGGYKAQSNNSIDKSSMLSFNIALGGDYKIGCGRVFLEVLVVSELVGSKKNIYTSDTHSETNTYNLNSFKYREQFTQAVLNSGFLNVGYTLYF